VIVGVKNGNDYQIPEVNLRVFNLGKDDELIIFDSANNIEAERPAFERYGRFRGVKVRSVISDSDLPEVGQIQKILAGRRGYVIFPKGYNEVIPGFKRAGVEGVIASWASGEAGLALSRLVGENPDAAQLRQQIPDWVLQIIPETDALTEIKVQPGQEDHLINYYLTWMQSHSLQTAA
jgi:hypothetical protein